MISSEGEGRNSRCHHAQVHPPTYPAPGHPTHPPLTQNMLSMKGSQRTRFHSTRTQLAGRTWRAPARGGDRQGGRRGSERGSSGSSPVFPGGGASRAGGVGTAAHGLLPGCAALKRPEPRRPALQWQQRDTPTPAPQAAPALKPGSAPMTTRAPKGSSVNTVMAMAASPTTCRPLQGGGAMRCGAAGGSRASVGAAAPASPLRGARLSLVLGRRSPAGAAPAARAGAAARHPATALPATLPPLNHHR